MTIGPALPCPSCKRALEAHSWHGDTGGYCRRCAAEFDFVPFPALKAVRAAVSAQAAVLDAESVCFFHAQNRAEGVCENCGRLLCSVCTVPYLGRKLCPGCVADLSRRADAAPDSIRNRVLHDSIALTLALFPLLVFFITIVTAPVTIGYVIYAWRQRGSLVRGLRRWKLVVAAVVALLEIAGWAYFLFLRPGRGAA